MNRIVVNLEWVNAAGVTLRTEYDGPTILNIVEAEKLFSRVKQVVSADDREHLEHIFTPAVEKKPTATEVQEVDPAPVTPTVTEAQETDPAPTRKKSGPKKGSGSVQIINGMVRVGTKHTGRTDWESRRNPNHRKGTGRRQTARTLIRCDGCGTPCYVNGKNQYPYCADCRAKLNLPELTAKHPKRISKTAIAALDKVIAAQNKAAV